MSVVAAFRGGPLNGKIAKVTGPIDMGMSLSFADGIEYVLADSPVNRAVVDLVAEGKDPGSLGLGFNYKEESLAGVAENNHGNG